MVINIAVPGLIGSISSSQSVATISHASTTILQPTSSKRSEVFILSVQKYKSAVSSRSSVGCHPSPCTSSKFCFLLFIEESLVRFWNVDRIQCRAKNGFQRPRTGSFFKVSSLDTINNSKYSIYLTVIVAHEFSCMKTFLTLDGARISGQSLLESSNTLSVSQQIFR